ncbi:MAG: alpha/beta hydrolase [Coprobacillus sp.]
MEKEILSIQKIPSIIWGTPSNKVIIAIHGSMSNKADIPIEILAKIALSKGYQVFSFDLPEHGDRKDDERLCKVQECVDDLTTMMQYAKERWSEISLFANSMGAYFSLLAYQNETIDKALFLSPVVDMERIIENMMHWFEISEERLEKEETIPTPIGQTLYWDYYCYVKEHPIKNWNIDTFILYGDKDDMCEKDTISGFVEKHNCELQVVEECEHYFHTSYQLHILETWLKNIINGGD